MITAQELRETQALNATAVGNYLGAIQVKLQVHSEKSDKRELFLYVNGLWESYEDYRVLYVEPSGIQSLLMKELTNRGYGVTFGKAPGCSGYIPRGLADDYGEGPVYFNVGITVRW